MQKISKVKILGKIDRMKSHEDKLKILKNRMGNHAMNTPSIRGTRNKGYDRATKAHRRYSAQKGVAQARNAKMVQGAAKKWGTRGLAVAGAHSLYTKAKESLSNG